MIEPKDASTCDERRVKNKLNLLTHKKRGETHTMGNQGMKSWKLGVFFVVSLMLVAGMFADTATAQTARVWVDPTEVTAESIESITVTYRATSTITFGGSDDITVALPEGWMADDGNFGSFPADLGNPESLTEAAEVSSQGVIDAGESPDMSYVTVTFDPARSEAEQLC